MKKLLFKEVVNAGAHVHVGRIVHGRSQGTAMHTHDFAEVFWIEQGTGVHQVNGRSLPMQSGALVLIRPKDAHGFTSRDPNGFVMVNIAFEEQALEAIRKTYFAKRDWPWQGGALPAQFTIKPVDVDRLHTLSDELAGGGFTTLERDAFLLQLLQLLTARKASRFDRNRPAWFDEAISSCDSPDAFAQGVQGLAKRSGKSPEHVNRVCRQHFKKTATDVVNDLRMNWAGRQLRMTNRTIRDIAFDCGIENLGYFYRIFRERFQVTPRQLRMNQRMTVG